RAVAPLLMESVRGHLQENSRGRDQERVPWYHPLRLWPVLEDGSLGPPVDCQGKDLSLNGVGFYLPGTLLGPDVCLYLPATEQTQEMLVAAQVVRSVACGEGWVQVGAALAGPWHGPVPDHEAPGRG